MPETKTYCCSAKYYKDGKVYERGELITVPASAPKSSVWVELSEELPAEPAGGIPGYGPSTSAEVNTFSGIQAQSPPPKHEEPKNKGGRASDKSPI